MKTKIFVESYLGDCFKVIAFQIDDLFEKDRLQCDEILALIESRLKKLPEQRGFMPRPKSTKLFEDNYNSHNLYTQTLSKHEHCASDRLDVIQKMGLQIMKHDGLSSEDVFSGVVSYVRTHLSDGEEAEDLPSTPPKN